MFKIAICGKAGTGKDTLSKFLLKEMKSLVMKDSHKYKYLYMQKLAFANPIKEMVRNMFPDLPRKYLFGSSKFRKEVIPGSFSEDGKPLTVRQVLLDLGTQGRKYREDMWLNRFDQSFNDLVNKNSSGCAAITIVTDVRFRNEFDHLKKKNFFQIKLYRPTDEPTINHESETNQNLISDTEFDYVLHNDKSLALLKEEVINHIIPKISDK